MVEHAEKRAHGCGGMPAREQGRGQLLSREAGGDDALLVGEIAGQPASDLRVELRPRALLGEHCLGAAQPRLGSGPRAPHAQLARILPEHPPRPPARDQDRHRERSGGERGPEPDLSPGRSADGSRAQAQPDGPQPSRREQVLRRLRDGRGSAGLGRVDQETDRLGANGAVRLLRRIEDVHRKRWDLQVAGALGNEQLLDGPRSHQLALLHRLLVRRRRVVGPQSRDLAEARQPQVAHVAAALRDELEGDRLADGNGERFDRGRKGPIAHVAEVEGSRPSRGR